MGFVLVDLFFFLVQSFKNKVLHGIFSQFLIQQIFKCQRKGTAPHTSCIQY